MLIRLIQVGKTEDPYLIEGIEKYARRIPFYTSYEVITIPSSRKLDQNNIQKIKKNETESILKRIGNQDYLVVLDEKGKEFTSLEFSEFIHQFSPLGSLSGFKTLSFVIGGPFGFDDEIYEASKIKVSLSKMTFSHQMIRLLFTEQLYRAFTILKNEPYHHF